jgi:uncharacterized damage-inducible protein DinB
VRHSREEVVGRMSREFELLDRLVANFTDEDWERPAPRPESRDPWTVKDALAHITYWKANTLRVIRKERRPAEERGLVLHETNRLIWQRWRDRSSQEVLAWHRQVQQELLAALDEAPGEWFSGKEHGEPWPADLDGHSAYHRVRDLEAAVETGQPSQTADTDQS